MNFLISGATGLIGKKLCHLLQCEGHQITILSRSLEKGSRLGYRTIVWQPEKEVLPTTVLEGIDVVIHLAGEHIAAQRWTAEHKQRIRNSRVLSTRNIVAAFHASANKPKTFICASAIGFYGDRGDEKLTESAPAGKGYLSDVCLEWETEAASASDLNVRVVQTRIGVVLASPNDGGALKDMMPIFKLGLGGNLGNGSQWFPWIHVNDVVGIIHHAIFNESISGPINTVAPNSVTNAEFTGTLAKVIHRPAIFSAPGFMLRLGLGEMADLLLGSARVIPEKALTTGYQFKFPNLQPALVNLLSSPSDDTEA